MKMRIGALLMTALSLVAQTPQRSAGILVTMSALDTPESVGRDFAGDIYFAYHGRVAIFNEVGGKLHLRRISDFGLQGAEARHIRFRNGVPSVKRGLTIWESNGNGEWFQALPFSGRFSDFVPTFDGRWVLFNAADADLSHSAQAVVTDGSSQRPKVLIPWDEKEMATSKSMSEFKFILTVSNLAIPYQELIAYYGEVSGRLRVIDPIKGSVHDIQLPWAGAEGEDPDKARQAIEARVPKRLQVIPAPDEELIFVWDQNLVGADPEAAAAITKARGRDYRALAVNLETGDKRELQVPKGLEFPMYSPDGLTLASLGVVFEHGVPASPGSSEHSPQRGNQGDNPGTPLRVRP